MLQFLFQDCYISKFVSPKKTDECYGDNSKTKINKQDNSKNKK